ncbi:flagellar type III secretion system pore protein FliP [Anaeromyxobacter paludicola]|uniref:Flagellar biosynthetic protein FliP n=1 Tax=Anaeromyxobacter paludicola TaxID=2918171 RepID=A0ABM7XAR3_9BACT|nr:flagellar type III secretion system pore protein FliP [Anaeromyxobacter paludicola]BDG08946.1 flagellar biosynthetic protein FliP [Anaeromyxobacter paludicola]
MTGVDPAPLLGAGPAGDHPAQALLLLGAMALLPAAFVTLTSFLKMSVVLGVARSALGAPQVPPGTAVTGLALLLTFTAMAPVAEASWRAAREPAPPGVEGVLVSAGRAAEPLRAFLRRFARPDDRRAFLELSARARPAGAAPELAPPGPPSEDDFAVLAPAFVVSELRRAFTMGFLVFLPFLVVDLFVASVLLSLGLTQLSPTSVALPFKLLLFVAADGWRVLARGLVAGYLP